MNFLFLMNPLEIVKYEKDTSFALMLGAKRKGHEVFYLPQGGISISDDSLEFDVTSVVPQEDPENLFQVGEKKKLIESEVDAVFIRTDPPFDEKYLMDTWLLDRLSPEILVINRPSGIRTANEKLWAAQFKELIPRTLVTQKMEDYLEFLKEEKEIIAKPADGFGGMSVFRVRNGEVNAKVIFETLSKNEKEYVVLQQFIPEAEMGDKRIILLNGEAIGAVLRVHSESDHRNNFFTGGRAERTQITESDKEIIEALKPKLQELGLSFVGIDVIGDYLIEVNVTSPTCLQEINRLYGVRLEDQVIEFVEKSLKKSPF